MKKKLILALLGIVLILVIVSLTNINKKAQIELTQLSSRTQDGMMGYFIRTNSGKNIVIDGGIKEEADKLAQYIKSYGNKVDYWFLTHPHEDHVGAFIEIVENKDIEIDNIYYTANELEWFEQKNIVRTDEVEKFYKTLGNSKIKSKIKEPQIGEEILIDNGIKIEILGIKNPEITENAINNSSMVFKLYVNKKTIMFLGDTGTESSNKLIKMHTKNKLKSDIVQISHHGNNGATEELYQLIQPEICLWPTPNWLWDNNSGNGFNTGNWTTVETRTWMEKIGVKTHYVAKDGDITITVK